MNEQKLKEAMEHVHITEQMQEDIISHVHGQRKNRRRPRLNRFAASAAAILLTIGVIGIPVRAGIQYLVWARMEQIPQEELADTARMVEEQKQAADGFSRAYTDQEQARMKELFKAYQTGTFPSGELFIVPSEDQLLPDTLCYTEDTGCFYLPDREMTDEELLQIIDFDYKREYSLEQSEEVQAAKAEQKAKEEEQRALVEAGGGITEAEALQIAREQIKAILDVDTTGMEETVRLDSDQFKVPAYCVTFDVRSRSFHSIAINAVDKTILNLSQNDESWPEPDEVQPMEESQALEELDTLYDKAQSFLRDQLGITDTIETIFALYTVNDGYMDPNQMNFVFLLPDGTAHRLDYYCGVGDFSEYRRTDEEHCMDYINSSAEKKIIPLK